MKIWIILCKNGGRIASIEHTEENLKEVKSMFYYNILFTNYDGTVYLNITGIKKEKE